MSAPGDTSGAGGRPPRRKRYRGTHPRRFEERYKELAPERYPETAEKVAASGRTPAGSHRAIMVREVLEALRPRPGEVALDCTLGAGGHAEAIWPHIQPGGRLIGLDLDGEELRRTAERLSSRGVMLSPRHASFAGAARALGDEGVEAADMVLADLGVSSMQLDRPERGFSYKHEGPIDMRMDRSRGVPASEWLARVDIPELAEVLASLGDVAGAERIADAIACAMRAPKPPATTRALAAVVVRAMGIEAGRVRQRSASDPHPAARVFQAIRMAVNREQECLAQLLRTLPYLLDSGGRAAVLTFHSGEETRVATALAEGVRAGLYRAASQVPLRPTLEEVGGNSRSRSARLHWAVRADFRR